MGFRGTHAAGSSITGRASAELLPSPGILLCEVVPTLAARFLLHHRMNREGANKRQLTRTRCIVIFWCSASKRRSSWLSFFRLNFNVSTSTFESGPVRRTYCFQCTMPRPGLLGRATIFEERRLSGQYSSLCPRRRHCCHAPPPSHKAVAGRCSRLCSRRAALQR